MKTKSPLLERDVQRTITETLELDGWRSLRTDPGSDVGVVRAIIAALREFLPEPWLSKALAAVQRCMRGKGFGEEGMPDYLYIRYWHPGNPIAEVMFIEFKRPGGKPEPHQHAWHEAERARGALVVVADSIEGFYAWYMASGLARRVKLERG